MSKTKFVHQRTAHRQGTGNLELIEWTKKKIPNCEARKIENYGWNLTNIESVTCEYVCDT